MKWRNLFNQPATLGAIIMGLATIAGVCQQWYSAIQDKKEAGDAGLEVAMLLAEANGKIEVAHTNALQYEHRIGELSGQLMVINRLVDQWATRPPSASEVGGAKSNLAKASVMTRQFQTNLAARVTLLQPVKPKLSSLEALNRAATKR